MQQPEISIHPLIGRLPLLEVYAHDFRNNKSQKKTPAASDRCSTINYLFFIKTNTEFLNSNSPNLKL